MSAEITAELVPNNRDLQAYVQALRARLGQAYSVRTAQYLNEQGLRQDASVELRANSNFPLVPTAEHARDLVAALAQD